MPVRNVVRFQAPNAYYHIYNRGHNKDLLYADHEDYQLFTFLLQRCFGPSQIKSQNGKLYPWFGDKVVLNAFCLMPNHFHLLLHQNDDETAISKAMQSLATTYSMYFNRKYKRRGPLFESTFKAAAIFSDSYLQHISRYIHLNPKQFKTWAYSSYSDYLGSSKNQWVTYQEILDLFDGLEHYITFVNDYVALRDELSELKYELADDGHGYYAI